MNMDPLNYRVSYVIVKRWGFGYSLVKFNAFKQVLENKSFAIKWRTLLINFFLSIQIC